MKIIKKIKKSHQFKSASLCSVQCRECISLGVDCLLLCRPQGEYLGGGGDFVVFNVQWIHQVYSAW